MSAADNFEAAKALPSQGFFNRARLAEHLEGEDPAKALLTWIRTAVDAFLGDSGGPQTASEGWSIFQDWIAKHCDRQDLDLSQPAEQLLQRIAVQAARGKNDLSAPVEDLRIVEPWIDNFFDREH